MTCPRCGMPALVLDNGLTLTPHPTHLGLHRADGTRLDVPDIVQLVRTTGNAGHDKHDCPNPPHDAQQPSLFEPQEA